jgi:hypothetical protein
MQKRHVQQKILAPITPNATAGTMNLSAVFTRVEVLKHLHHHSIGQSNFPIQRDKRWYSIL